jgi:hypothetical protein
MKKIRVAKLGTKCRDKATGLDGTLTHWVCDLAGVIKYLFQPKGVNPEDGQPVSKIGLELERLEFSDDPFEDVEVPFEVLGTFVADDASGFNGIAVAFVRHINGCFHVVIQPQGSLPKTNSPITRADFDLRQCVGEKIPKLDQKELAESRDRKPSPTGDRFLDDVSFGNRTVI